MSKGDHLDIQKSLCLLADFAAGLVALIVSGAASDAPGDNSVPGVSSIADASATIVNPTSLRAAELLDIETDFGRASGLAVAPAAIMRRNCVDDSEPGRCNLIILDMP
jgi:hypothetical protein